MRIIYRRLALAILLILLMPGMASSALPCYIGMINMPAASLRPRLETTGINNVGAFLGTNDTGVDFYAPLILPHGAKITKMEMEAYDASTTSYIEAKLRRSHYAVRSTLASINTGCGCLGRSSLYFR